jgi:hypothetical protein
MIKPRKMKCTEHIERMGRSVIDVGKARKKRDHWGGQDIGEWIIIKWFLKK